jgi:hypothetical protein
MNFGWWADLGFVPGGCPYCTSDSAGWWMNAGMLALGVPAMFLLRRRRLRFRWRQWCCGGMVVLGIPGMVLGMLAGSVLARALFPASVTADYLFMMAGMCLGMMLPHALEFALPNRSLRRVGTAPER